MDKLNIVVICIDTFRADIVGPGKKLSSVATPALDALAAESVRFNRCFTEPGPTLAGPQRLLYGDARVSVSAWVLRVAQDSR